MMPQCMPGGGELTNVTGQSVKIEFQLFKNTAELSGYYIFRLPPLPQHPNVVSETHNKTIRFLKGQAWETCALPHNPSCQYRYLPGLRNLPNILVAEEMEQITKKANRTEKVYYAYYFDYPPPPPSSPPVSFPLVQRKTPCRKPASLLLSN